MLFINHDKLLFGDSFAVDDPFGANISQSGIYLVSEQTEREERGRMGGIGDEGGRL